MKLRIASLTLLVLCLAAVPMMAADVYDNGPDNGNVDAWNIAFGFAVSDSYSCQGCGVTGFNGWFWVVPGDSLRSLLIS